MTRTRLIFLVIVSAFVVLVGFTFIFSNTLLMPVKAATAGVEWGGQWDQPEEFYGAVADHFSVRVIAPLEIPFPDLQCQATTLEDLLTFLAQNTDLRGETLNERTVVMGPARAERFNPALEGVLRFWFERFEQETRLLDEFMQSLSDPAYQELKENWKISLDSLSAEQKERLYQAIDGKERLDAEALQRHEDRVNKLEGVEVGFLFWPTIIVVGQDGRPMGEALAMSTGWYEILRRGKRKAWQEAPSSMREEGERASIAWPRFQPIHNVGGEDVMALIQRISDEIWRQDLEGLPQPYLDKTIPVEERELAPDKLMRLISEATEQETILDARFQSQRLFITPDHYTVRELFASGRFLWGLHPRRVQKLIFLTPNVKLSGPYMLALLKAKVEHRAAFWQRKYPDFLPEDEFLKTVGTTFPPESLRSGGVCQWQELGVCGKGLRRYSLTARFK